MWFRYHHTLHNLFHGARLFRDQHRFIAAASSASAAAPPAAKIAK
jgi:hypothetical protein